MEEEAVNAEYSQAFAALTGGAPEEVGPEEASEAPVEEAVEAEEPVEATAEAPDDSAEAQAEEVEEEHPSQQEKSWQGRLEKREAELKAREEALAAKEAEAHKDAEADPKAPSIVDQIREQASTMMSGEDFESRIAEAAEEYGAEFLALAAALGASMYDPMSKKTVDQLDGRINDLSGAIQNEFRSAHIDRIAQDHPDYAEVVESEGFQEWLGALSEEEQAKAKTLLQNGRARPIAKLLTKYKDAMNKPEEVEDDAAAGVRGSAPVNIPHRPAMNEEDEYSAAFKRLMKA